MAYRSAFAITERGTGSVVGSSRYHGYDAGRSEIEIGWTNNDPHVVFEITSGNFRL